MNRLTRALAVTGTATALVLSLSACAPEPQKVAGTAVKGGSETLRTESVPDDTSKKSTELPDSFPKEQFALPAGATIDDTGERGEDAWFLVLRAENDRDADVLWQAVIDQNAFEVSEDTEAGLTILQNSVLRVEALRLSNAGEDTVLLSFDIATAAPQ